MRELSRLEWSRRVRGLAACQVAASMHDAKWRVLRTPAPLGASLPSLSCAYSTRYGAVSSAPLFLPLERATPLYPVALSALITSWVPSGASVGMTDRSSCSLPSPYRRRSSGTSHRLRCSSHVLISQYHGSGRLEAATLFGSLRHLLHRSHAAHSDLRAPAPLCFVSEAAASGHLAGGSAAGSASAGPGSAGIACAGSAFAGASAGCGGRVVGGGSSSSLSLSELRFMCGCSGWVACGSLSVHHGCSPGSSRRG